MKRSRERRYAIQLHDCYGLYTGLTPNDEQVLMGLFCPDLVAFHFDREGNLLRIDQRPVPFFQGVTPPYNIYDKRIPRLIKAWQKEMGLRPATIQVRKFFSHELYIGIEDYPSDFEEILSDPAADEEEKADVRRDMKSWDKDGQFVLQWGNDYWLDESGEVVSS
jgi:hypothetical protein